MAESDRPLSCCILQPTFLPWLGWFDLVDQVDLLVVLDDAGFSKQSWQQRNRIRTERGLDYVSVPVRTAGRLGQPINEVEVADPAFADSVLGRVRQSYRKAPHFEETFGMLEAALRAGAESGRLVDVNMSLIGWMLDSLGIAVPWTLASGVCAEGRRGFRVAALCEAVGAERYVSPAGASDYLLEDRAAFDESAIEVLLHRFEHPTYEQVYSPFMPYASTLDLLMSRGAGAIDVIRSGRSLPQSLDSAREEQP